MQRYQFIKKSGNEKTGPIPVTNTSSDSCPDACPLKHNGCYAEAGYYTRLNWTKLDAGERGTDFDGLLEGIRSIRDGQLWRHDVSGDLPGFNNAIDTAKLAQLVDANKGKRGFTYTHKPVLDNPVNAAAVRDANEQGFTVNLSANNAAHADELKALDIGPVVTIVPEHCEPVSYTPAGNKIVVCPAQQKDNVTCASCGLCQIATRKVIIGFQVHGNGKKKAEELMK